MRVTSLKNGLGHETLPENTRSIVLRKDNFRISVPLILMLAVNVSVNVNVNVSVNVNVNVSVNVNTNTIINSDPFFQCPK